MSTVQATQGTERRHIAQREGPLLLSVPEAARLLGVGPTFGWEMVHTGQLPSVRLGRRVLVPRAAVDNVASLSRSRIDSEQHDDSGLAGQ